MWTCPNCERRFGAVNRPHMCAPAMSVDEYFAGRGPVDRAIYDAVEAVVTELGEVEIEAVAVGILFRTTRTFAELRPRRRGLALSVVLDRPLTSSRVTRRIPMAGVRVANIVVLTAAADVDDEIAGWLAESYETCSQRRR